MACRDGVDHGLEAGLLHRLPMDTLIRPGAGTPQHVLTGGEDARMLVLRLTQTSQVVARLLTASCARMWSGCCRWTRGWPQLMPSSRRLAWLATLPTGVPVGSAFLRLFSRVGQDYLAELDLHVHPAERRSGVGSRLLTAALAAAREEGRRCVIAQAEPGSPGDVLLSARGFRKVLTLTYARLPLAQTNPDDLREIMRSPHPGYRLVAWDGVVPDELAETFARPATPWTTCRWTTPTTAP
ncbi:GNAT family N-acetyltransferase [Nonomuraea dietziae]|uniref:GNAT family N-acetyltransferase n=1 Tax=Nonomuraea dietziae TaxID=65515 RepID=UPI0034120CF6